MIQYLGDEFEMQKSVNSTFAKSKNLSFKDQNLVQSKKQQITFEANPSIYQTITARKAFEIQPKPIMSLYNRQGIDVLGKSDEDSLG